jgi:kexin
MKPLVLLPLVLALAHLTTAIHPTPRDYKTHTYYSLETAEHASLADVQHFARSMGGEAVEQIGELRGHWLIRSNPDDQMRKRSFDHAKMKLTELPVQKRTKRQFDPLLHPDNKTLHHLSSPYLPRQDPETPQDLTELHFLQDTLKFADPLLPSQWHLVNTELPEVELNLTQLWGRGVNGTGVVVAIIDDGLDIDSDDLAGNFVSPAPQCFLMTCTLVLRRLHIVLSVP